MNPVLADAGFLVAVYDRHERFHDVCLQVYESLNQPLVTCEPVIAESLHLLRSIPGAGDDLLASIEEGILELRFSLRDSASAVRKIMKKYQDVEADLADACLIHMADELNTGDILTLDSDFKHYRWRRNRTFRMLIPLG